MIKEIFNFQFSIFNSRRGFTVLESIVAIAVLALSVTGVFAAVTQSFSQATIAKDEVKAFYLAQEAIEIIRNKRDENQLAKVDGFVTTSWLHGITEDLSDPCYFGKICRADAKNFSLTDCEGGWDSCPNLNQDPGTFIYSYDAFPETNFKREIQIESVNANEIIVTVEVSWSKGLLNREFKVKTHLFNWI